MSDHAETLGKILNKTLYAVADKQLYGSAPYAAEVFEVLMRHHGLTVVSTGGLVVRGDAYGDEQLDVVSFGADLLVHPPELPKPYTPELAFRLGNALIAASVQATEYGKEYPNGASA